MAPIGNISEFKANFRYGGARTSRFQVILSNPINPDGDSQFTFFCTAAGLPGWNITPIEVFHAGRPVKVPGNRTFEDWNTTVLIDEDFRSRNSLEHWSNSINALEANVRRTGTSETAAIQSTAEVSALSQTNQILRTYKFVGIWPSSIGQIDMDWSSENIMQQQVTWSYDFFHVSDTITGNAGGI